MSVGAPARRSSFATTHRGQLGRVVAPEHPVADVEVVRDQVGAEQVVLEALQRDRLAARHRKGRPRVLRRGLPHAEVLHALDAAHAVGIGGDLERVCRHRPEVASLQPGKDGAHRGIALDLLPERREHRRHLVVDVKVQVVDVVQRASERSEGPSERERDSEGDKGAYRRSSSTPTCPTRGPACSLTAARA